MILYPGPFIIQESITNSWWTYLVTNFTYLLYPDTGVKLYTLIRKCPERKEREGSLLYSKIKLRIF